MTDILPPPPAFTVNEVNTLLSVLAEDIMQETKGNYLYQKKAFDKAYEMLCDYAIYRQIAHILHTAPEFSKITLQGRVFTLKHDGGAYSETTADIEGVEMSAKVYIHSHEEGKALYFYFSDRSNLLPFLKNSSQWEESLHSLRDAMIDFPETSITRDARLGIGLHNVDTLDFKNPSSVMQKFCDDHGQKYLSIIEKTILSPLLERASENIPSKPLKI